MKTRNRRHLRLITAVFLVAAPLAAGATAATSVPGIQKLDARLAMIAAAAAENHVEPLKSEALTRELFLQNSPLAARWNAAGEVQVYLHFNIYGNAPTGAELAALGATDTIVSPELGLVQTWIPATKLAQAAALSDVSRISVPRYAVVKRAPQSSAVPRTGSVDTQGDQIMGAAAFRQKTGFNGSGISVGIISNGDTSIAESEKTGDLPANIWNDPNNGSFMSSGDEGTAMMEIVYDLAPGVKQLGFCGPATTVDFVTCLNDFASHFGSSNLVIADDLGFPGVAMFTDGGFATAVKNFAIAHPNVQLVTAAGNDAQGFWSGTWNASTVNTKVNNVAYTQAENFGIGDQVSFKVLPGDTVSWILEWDDAWPDSVNGKPPTGANDPNDYDIVLFSSSGTPLACNQGINISNPGPPTATGTYQPCNQTNSQPLNTPGPQPVQGNAWTNNTGTSASVYLQIFKVAGNPGPNLKLLVGSLQSNVIAVFPNTPSGSIFGQSALASPYEITVGAVNASSTGTIEPYSSQGPVTLTLINETRTKPDFVGVDCVNTTGAGGFPEPFCGTSAAAPHITGLIALLESAYPNQSPYTELQMAAVPLSQYGSSPNNTAGYGLPNISTLQPPPLKSTGGGKGGGGLEIWSLIMLLGLCLIPRQHIAKF